MNMYNAVLFMLNQHMTLKENKLEVNIRLLKFQVQATNLTLKKVKEQCQYQWQWATTYTREGIEVIVQMNISPKSYHDKG